MLEHLQIKGGLEMITLEQIKSILSTNLGSPAMFSLVNTRLILRTGVDLAEISQTDNANRDSIAKVLKALEAMGYQTSAFERTPQKGSVSP